jgi:hypothetical protein
MDAALILTRCEFVMNTAFVSQYVSGVNTYSAGIYAQAGRMKSDTPRSELGYRVSPPARADARQRKYAFL